MSDTLARAMVALLFGGLALNTWMLWGVSSQIHALDARMANVEMPVGPSKRVVRFEPPPQADDSPRPEGKLRPDAKGRKGRKARRAKNKPRPELSEEEKLARLASRFESAELVVSEFAAAESLDAAAQATVLEELQLMHQAVLAIRQDVRATAITHNEGRKEARQLREDSDARLSEILSVRQVAALRERLAAERE